MDFEGPLMRIGELAQRSGVSVRSLRYYEQQGLLTPERSESGQRLFAQGAIEYVLFFQDMYAAGLTSRDVAMLLPCMETGLTDTQQREMLRSEHQRISVQIERLQAALGRLDRVIEFADGHAGETVGEASGASG